MASIRFRQGGVWKDASSYRYRSGGQWLQPSRIMARISGAWVQVWQAFTAYISGGFNQTSAGNNRYQDIGSFNVQKSGGGAITSYSWAVNDYGGQLSFFQGANSANYSMRGPQYTPLQFNPTYDVVVGCTFVVDGVTRYAEQTFTYTGTGDM